jgi:glycosyltransferase involved in cell wall biosynthesis
MVRTEHFGDCPPVVAYLANSIPSPVEPYVCEEINELRRRGIRVIPCSVWRATHGTEQPDGELPPTLALAVWQPWILLRAVFLCCQRFGDLRVFFRRIFCGEKESWTQRSRALAHTWLGAMLALRLRDQNVRQIAIHHGYMAAWIGMVAARLLGIPYSLTLHGSDLLLHPTFLDTKLEHCAVCFTVSEFNRNYLLERYPQISPGRVRVRRMGVCVAPRPGASPCISATSLNLLAVGRLHPVKDHAFLVRACAALKASGLELSCRIAGEGPERGRLKRMIRNLHLEREVHLLGHVTRNQLNALYHGADIVVLTSVSEGIPLTLMEAMSLGTPVLAPAITGIPELVADEETGFLYEAGSITSFIERVEFVWRNRSALGFIRQAGYEQVKLHFNLATNLQKFADDFIEQIFVPQDSTHADSLLQQVQL